MTTKLGKLAADFDTSLATTIEIGGTSGTLQSATDDDGVALPAGTYYFAIDGSNSNKEHIQCALSGTAITSIKSVSRQGVLTSGTVRKHRAGASVKLTDFATIKYIQDLLDGTTDLNASTPLKYDGTATLTDDNHLATKVYADGIATAGAPDAGTTTKGITKLSVAAASPTNPIALGDNDPRIPTSGQASALAGNGGTPGSGNKYVTETGFSTSFTTSLSAVNPAIVHVYTSSTTWTKPANLKYIVVEVQGSGGGSASQSADGATNGASAGGYGKKLILAASLGATETVTVGAGGAGGTSGGDGSDGNVSSFGAFVTANGGTKSTAGAAGAFIAGGTATGGDINIQGGNGGPFMYFVAQSPSTAGKGGSSVLGLESSYGAGGFGVTHTGTGSANGNAGQGGVVIVTEYYV